MTNRAIVEELYRCFRERDEDGIRRVCAPDIEWIQCAGFPNGAERRGVEAVIEGVLKANRAAWEDFGFHRDRLIEAGETIVALGRYRGRHRGTGKSMEAVVAHVYELVDGRIVRFRMFADTHPMHLAMR